VLHALKAAGTHATLPFASGVDTDLVDANLDSTSALMQ
jgi:hypothetical protein